MVRLISFPCVEFRIGKFSFNSLNGAINILKKILYLTIKSGFNSLNGAINITIIKETEWAILSFNSLNGAINIGKS